MLGWGQRKGDGIFMKLIKIFLTFTLISLFWGINSAYNGKTIQQDVNNSNEIIESVEENIEKEEKADELEENIEQKSVITEQKQEEIEKSDVKEQSNQKKEQKSQNQATVESKSAETSSDVVKYVEKPIWEEIGITEYEYYHSPMMKWQHVTHSSFSECQKDGEEAIKVKLDQVTGGSYQEYTSYWCYDVNSYSGDWLGIMLSLSK